MVGGHRMALRGLVFTIDVLVRRLLREGLILRSLVWPEALTSCTLLATLVVLSLIRPVEVVALGEAANDPALRAAIENNGWQPAAVDDPAAWVESRRAWAGTDGHTIWVRFRRLHEVRLEALLRERAGASWRPAAVDNLPSPADTAASGDSILRVLSVLFALYGIVFGLGMVARDRDDGSLEAELSLPLPRWVPGAARWIASTLVLSVFFGLCVLVFDALIGVSDAAAAVRHGAAACGAATALGLMVVGTAGLRQGFSGPFALGMSGATGLVAAGLAIPQVGTWLPLSSLMAGGSGWAPLAGAAVMGIIASAIFGLRSGRA